jgi:hypothetical protein
VCGAHTQVLVCGAHTQVFGIKPYPVCVILSDGDWSVQILVGV